jgi:hypothetical protein
MLFVATSLAVWSTKEPERFARDFQINDTVYRRLDPDYYAWLRSRMALAKRAASAGKIDPEAFEDLRKRFNAAHEWAIQHFGEAALLSAVKTLRVADYEPPVPEDDGPRTVVSQKKAGIDPDADAVAMVDAIAETALSLGWKRERLYGVGNGRLFDPNRGLVSFLKQGDRLGPVTLQSIEIIGPPPSEVRQHFYNPDVGQPWIRRLAAPATG